MIAGDASGQTPAPPRAPGTAAAGGGGPGRAGTASSSNASTISISAVRFSDRKLELAQEAAAAERKAAPVTTVDEKGLNVKSGGDGNFRVGVHGLLQVDGRRVFDDPVLYDKDTWVVRRARPILTRAGWASPMPG